jgi:hypothetical protein
MRIRTIKPEFFLHEDLFTAEKETKMPLRVAFAGLWCAADREGRFKWEPRRLGIQILPYDEIDFSRVLDALATRGFIVSYASTTGNFGFIPSFLRHQVINNRERMSDLPDPLECTQNEHIDASATRDPRDDHACKEEGKGKEGNKEGKGKFPVEDFNEFWSAYPRKIAKADAERAWAKIRPDLQAVLTALEWQAKSEDWTRDGGKYIPYPASYLNSKRYEDEKPAPRSNSDNFIKPRQLSKYDIL